MLNSVWSFLLLAGILIGTLFGRLGGQGGITDAALSASKSAVMDIALPLAGAMMLWLGLLRVMDKAGMLEAMARFLAPLLRRLFPDVPDGHPAMRAMIMNVAANLLGLGNAATPMGLKAMEHLQELNPHPESATNAMCMFLALNTAGLTLIPITAINYLNAGGVRDPYSIIAPTIASTFCAASVAILSAKLLQRWPVFAARDVSRRDADTKKREAEDEPALDAGIEESKSLIRPNVSRRITIAVLAMLFAVGVLAEFSPPVRQFLGNSTGAGPILAAAAQREHDAAANASKLKAAVAAQEDKGNTETVSWRRYVKSVSALAIPAVFVIVILWGLAKGVPVYEEAVEGAKEGFQVATRIMPFLVIMLVALAIFRQSGALTLLGWALEPLLRVLHLPIELLPMAIMRPLSGSGSSGILSDIILNPASTDALRCTAATMYGSTETTFYVLAVYFGSVGIRRVRHALAVGIIADITGMTCALLTSWFMFH